VSLRDYSSVTEAPGTVVSQEAIAMVGTRYAFAAGYCAGQRVLEIACGPGVGLRYLSTHAVSVVGGDYTLPLLQQARAHGGARCRLVQLDAHHLPFASRRYDVVILFEALYFLADASRVITECLRVLSPGGRLIVANANPQRPGFNPAPHSTRYFTVGELEALLESAGCQVESFGAFPLEADGRLAPLISAARKVAVTLGLVPKTMRGKALLKRLVYGTIVRFPATVGPEHMTAPLPVRLTSSAQGAGYKVIYALAIAPSEGSAK
jgi:SAM-dependent methyltransferase